MSLFKDFTDLNNFLSKEEILFCNFRFTDSRGKWHHMTYDVDQISQNIFVHGIMFDGSSIAGWKEINNSDIFIFYLSIVSTRAIHK